MILRRRRGAFAGIVLFSVFGVGFLAVRASASWSDFWSEWRESVQGTGAERDTSQAGSRPAVAGVRWWDKDQAAGDVSRRNYAAVDKLDADHYGLLLLAQAGYDPTGLPRALQRTQAYSGSAKAKPFSDRHPSFQDRMQAPSRVESDVPQSGAVLKERFSRNVPL